MRKGKIVLILFACMLLSYSVSVYSAQINSSSYNQNVIISTGGENVTSSSYKMNLAVGIINMIINSASYINRLGFFHTLLLADNQPCTSASQCEGGFCCGNLCKSSPCPEEAKPSVGAAAAAGGGGGNVTVIELIRDFSVIPGFIKEHMALGTTKTNAITIKNTGNIALNFDLNILTINDFIFLSDTSFSLTAGQEKTVEFNIIGKKLGSYFGEIEVIADGIKKSISIVIEVESEQVLFDVKIDIPTAYKEVEPGGELKAQITLLNVGPPRKVDVTPTYIIKDKQGNVIYEASETFAVEGQVSYIKSFRLPKNLKPADYIVIVELRYENSFAVSSELFRVVEKEDVIERAIKLNRALIFVFVIFVGLIFLFVYLLIPKVRVSGRNLKKFYKVLDETKEALNNNDVSKAKELYLMARKLYDILEDNEKRIVYSKLSMLYNSLKSRLK